MHDTHAWRVLGLAGVMTLLLAAGCGGGSADAPGTGAGAALPGVTAAANWPGALPADAVQPWERTDAAGHVLPAHGASSFDSASEFVPGVERFLEGGAAGSLGEALQLTSGAAGAKQVSYAIYRLSLGASQPGAVAVDANLHPLSGGAGASGYYVGLSDYSRGRWEWRGPFTDHHVRLSTGAAVRAGTGYTTPLGDMFICVVAYDGAAVDVVGAGVQRYVAADVTAPPAPGGLTAQARAGGLWLQWNSVAASDLAGYRIYWRQAAFIDPHSPGVRTVDYLEGLSLHFLALPGTATYSAAVAALDYSGNESAVSAVVSAAVLSGPAPVLDVAASAPSALLHDPLSLTATGALTYHFDLDGDGVLDVTNATGLADADTTRTGLLRPLVLGEGPGGSSTALGGVSLIVTGNTRPAVSATAAPQQGPAPLSVSFSGAAEDLEDPPAALSYAWDFDGDGIYEADTNTLTPPPHVYTASGTYNCRLRVSDSAGAWATAAVTVQVAPGLDPGYTVAFGNEVNYPCAFMVGGLLSIVFQRVSNTEIYYVRAQRPDATTWSAPVQIGTATGGAGPFSAAIVNGNPAVCWTDLGTGDLVYVRASTPQGSAWNVQQIISLGPLEYHSPKMIISGTFPGIAAIYLGDNKPYFIRATDNTGTAWAGPQLIDPLPCMGLIDARVVAGNPAVVYSPIGSNEVHFCRGLDPAATSWGLPLTAAAGVAPNDLALEVLDGYPCIAICDHAARTLFFNRSKAADGTSWGSAIPAVQRGTSWLYAHDVVMRSYNGKPTLVYADSYLSTVNYCEAQDYSGNYWQTPWQIVPQDPIDYSYGPVGYENLGGVANIVHINHQPIDPHYEIRVTRFNH